jgi:hypothetical protein
MLYLNPFKLFDLSPEALPNTAERKLLFWEQKGARVQEGELLLVGSERVSKEYLMQLIQELRTPEFRAFHKLIFEQRYLLNFLEFGHLAYFYESIDTSYMEDASFLEFVMPYFSERFSEVLLQATQSDDFELIELLNTKALNGKKEGVVEEAFYGETSNYIKDTILRLQTLQRNYEIKSMSERELVSFLSNQQIKSINALPAYFKQSRNLIAREVYVLSEILIHHFGRADGAAVMLRQGLKLDLDEAVRSDLEAMLGRFNFKTQVPMFVWIGGGVILLLFLLRYIENTFM